MLGFQFFLTMLEKKIAILCSQLQDSYPLPKTNFQDSDWFFQDSKIHMNFCTPKISMLILLTICHTFQIVHLSLTNFQHFPGPAALFQDFSDLENATIKFQDFLGFPEPVRTLSIPGHIDGRQALYHYTMPLLPQIISLSYHWKLQKLRPVTYVGTHF